VIGSDRLSFDVKGFEERFFEEHLLYLRHRGEADDIASSNTFDDTRFHKACKMRREEH
jgi:hypothetical protein